MSTRKDHSERVSKYIKVNLTEDEYTQIEQLAHQQKQHTGPYVRSILQDYLRTSLSRGETLLLEAVAEVHANHLDVIRKSLAKQLSLSSLEELADDNRRCRRTLAQGFLVSFPMAETRPEIDEEDEEEDEE